MEIKQFRNLLAVVEEGSLTRAAQKLRVAQPALTKSIKRLEEELGITLFERVGRHLQPTAYAQSLLPYARDISVSMARCHGDLTALRTGRLGMVCIAAPPTVAAIIFPKLAAAHHQKFPDVNLRLLAESDNLTDRLLQGHFDFIIGSIPAGSSEQGLKSVPLFSDTLNIVARPSHSVFELKQASVRTFGKYKWILSPPGNLFRRRLEVLFESMNVAMPSRFIECGSLQIMKEIVCNTDTLALVPALGSRAELHAGSLKVVAVDTEPITRTIGIIWPGGVTQSKAAAELLHTLQAL